MAIRNFQMAIAFSINLGFCLFHDNFKYLVACADSINAGRNFYKFVLVYRLVANHEAGN